MKYYWKTLQNKFNNWRYAPVTNPEDIYSEDWVIKQVKSAVVKGAPVRLQIGGMEIL